MTRASEQGALYLQKDGRIELVHGDDVEARKADGWAEPTGQRANGLAYNRPEDQAARDAAAEFAKQDAADAADDAKEQAKAAKSKK